MSQDRRSFLRSLAGVAGALVASDASAVTRAVRTQVEPPGLQLYTVRGELQRDLPGTLARVAEIGYRELEFAGYYDRSPAEIRELLERHHLRAPSTHVGYGQLSTGWDAVLRTSRE